MTAILLDRAAQDAETAVACDNFDDDDSTAFFMPAGAMTLARFRKWTASPDFPENGKIAYLGKEIFINMSPERIDSHSSPKVEIYTVLGSFVRKKKKGRIFFDRTRIVHKLAQISNEPDAFFASWDTLKNGELKRIPSPHGDDTVEFEGTPDWALEIVSPSSVIKNKVKLRERYHQAGIREYWLIDARGGEIEFQILVHGDDDYVPAKRVGEWQVSPVFGKKFRLRRIEDELGDVDFRLDMK